ncbi:KpsF/GutQ family sugar-phosphate isomerase [Sulfuricurvum sp. IAE1]|jgi:arabinose-5-phosphate isomerase|uniref:KpsF/GutQ family sugar-phosphate isomerase n=1 Tax=Sulfuricurvum sp. IAE1 TaxID=2546102 RepID=UPI0010484BA6|nr:KpsF/GutQ family sugar-phosphate isomerase [Sulfuricurvum sp. IAE1]MDD3770154.1 KpsF/GutQ family sugar-phosphate isomerase [Sulfuricurvum sp.]MDX9965609.1 KpsF/GutQ family sugar-phosphate isomerase [Sulfuricurvum sp.]TDA68223.1 KpsF/GutQ family sugar-phosphate isomerase [Sulfuricurvum sp. IAE1]
MNNDYIAIAKNTLEIEAAMLNEAKERLGDEISRAVETILSCRGKLIVTGVGKSGLIGAKIAATFASTGTPSFFLHPTEALHGDLGMIGRDDAVLAISYSGESEELSSILPHIKRFDIPLIGMTRNASSTLGRTSDIVLDINVSKEACPLDAAPTSSTTLTLAMGDALAVCLMRARNFQKEDFASFHPGGALGKRLFVKVADLMRRENLPVVDQNTPLKEAILTLSEGRLGTVMLTDEEGKLSGLLSDGDIRRALMNESFSLDAPAKEYATKHPLSIDDASMLASDALVLIENKKIQLLVVTDNTGVIQGALHLHALVEAGIS